MSRALVVSLKFNPGHVSHLIASYRQCEELGYEAVFFLHPAFQPFLPSGCRMMVYEKASSPLADLAIFLFPSEKNLLIIRSLKKAGAKIVYIFHEPLAPLRVYLQAGFSMKYLVKLWIIDRISALTVKWSDIVFLPSRKAIHLYQENTLYKNSHYHYLPLLFDDEALAIPTDIQRKYFSYIGTVAPDHAFSDFLCFVEWELKNKKIPEIQFLIATKSEFAVPKYLSDSPRVNIIKGKPLSNYEINLFYASSFLVWNAYSRTTQSGVLAKCFMFGTPAIVLRKNLSEFTTEGEEVVVIDDKSSVDEIVKAIKEVLSNFDQYSKHARHRFIETFYYKKHNNTVKSILASV